MSAKLFDRFCLDPRRLTGQRVTIMGLGRFGGGAGAARFFAERGARVVITDSAKPEKLRESVDSLADLPAIQFHLGEHRQEDFTDADLLVVNPAVPYDSPWLELARRAEVPLSAEMNIFLQLCPAKVVGVTGSNGKSTTTAMIASILSAGADARQGGFRQVFLGGNIGKSLLPHIDQMTGDDVAVLELSSFQLEALAVEEISPHVAVWTNFSANHLDHHKTVEVYRQAKENIFRFQGPEDVLIHNADDPGLEFLGSLGAIRSRRASFSLTDTSADAYLGDSGLMLRYRGSGEVAKVMELSELPVPGEHNLANALAAACAAKCFALPPEIIRQGLRNFRPLPHRLELVATVDGVSYYDDSIATTPESALVGLNSFNRPPIIILGGREKGASFEQLLRASVKGGYAIICLGEVRQKLLSRLQELKSGSAQPYIQAVNSLEEAVKSAAKLARPGQAVLLSPACASYDMFDNYEHRGRRFAELVRQLPGKKG